MQTSFRYQVHEVAPYINWIYFFHTWEFQPRFATIANLHGCDACRAMWLASFEEQERGKAAEAMQLFKEANRMLQAMEQQVSIKVLFRLCKANSDGDNLLIENKTILPLLRQQTSVGEDDYYLCLSDFVRPLSAGIPDEVGLFAASVPDEIEKSYQADAYRHLLVQSLSDRLVEAGVEKMHQCVRRDIWGYAPDESLSMAELHAEKFRGIRPAVGYPSLPDQSVNFIIDHLLDLKQIGISLTENGAMAPHASVCGLMFSHPSSRYFSVGKIGEDQLLDYASRRGLPLEVVRKFLAANL